MNTDASYPITLKQSPQEIWNCLKKYHEDPWYAAFQHPLPPPKSRELVLNDPITGSDGKPFRIEFIHYKTVGYTEQTNHIEERYPITEPAVAILFEFEKLFEGTRVSAICFVEEWRFYFDELRGVLTGENRQEDNQPKPHASAEDSKLSTLSKRQREIYQLMLEGRERQDIADELGIAVSSVDAHIQNISSSLNMASITKSIPRLRKWLREQSNL